ncbi:substrate-binding domain-containing protein, partial [Thermodesulfobacteriota bacterium]
GSAKAGIGIFQAAKMLGLGYVHLTQEQYDLVVPSRHLTAEPVKALLQIIGSAEFKKKVKQMGGYDTRDTGKVIGS